MVCRLGLRTIDETSIHMRRCEISGIMSSDWDYWFEVVWADFAFTDDGGFDPEWSVSVLPDAVFCHDGVLVADGPRLEYDKVRRYFPETDDSRPQAEEPVKAKASVDPQRASIVEQLPWLMQCDRWDFMREEGSWRRWLQERRSWPRLRCRLGRR